MKMRPSGSRVVLCGRTDGRTDAPTDTDMTKLIFRARQKSVNKVRLLCKS